jgi:hypothetical protein
MVLNQCTKIHGSLRNHTGFRGPMHLPKSSAEEWVHRLFFRIEPLAYIKLSKVLYL